MKSNYIKSLQIIFSAIAIGQLVLAIVFFNLPSTVYFSIKENLNPMHFIVPIAAFSAILITQIFFKQSIKQLKIKDATALKLTGFRAVSIIKWAILELVATITCIAFSVSGNLYFMLIFTAMFVYYLLQFPSQKNVTIALNLPNDEINSF